MLSDFAIVLSLQRHSDRAHILHTYTRSSGRMNFLVYGLSSKRKSKGEYAPLSLIEITADDRPNRPIPTLKESTLVASPYSNSVSDYVSEMPLRQTVALFIAEVLFRTLRHPMQDEALFHFLENTISDLQQSRDIHHVHVRFLIGLASALGFAIDEEEHPELVREAISRSDRQVQLRQLCEYLGSHIDGFDIPVSLDILSAVFD